MANLRKSSRFPSGLSNASRTSVGEQYANGCALHRHLFPARGFGSVRSKSRTSYRTSGSLTEPVAMMRSNLELVDRLEPQLERILRARITCGPRLLQRFPSATFRQALHFGDDFAASVIRPPCRFPAVDVVARRADVQNVLGTSDDEGPSTALHGVKPFRSAATCCAVLQPAIFRSNMKYRGCGPAHGNCSMASSVRRGSDSWSARAAAVGIAIGFVSHNADLSAVSPAYTKAATCRGWPYSRRPRATVGMKRSPSALASETSAVSMDVPIEWDGRISRRVHQCSQTFPPSPSDPIG